MPKIVNIFLSVIDNLGDIGFAGELIRSFHEQYPGRYFFDIWTDSVEKTEKFFSVNTEISGIYRIEDSQDLTQKRGEISMLLFHHPIPKNYVKASKELFLRIDYLSFSREWIRYHGNEHLDSNEYQKIIEIIPSPLAKSGGIITPPSNLISRNELAHKFHLDVEKKWISLFCYEQTRKYQINFEQTENTEIIVLGTNPEEIQTVKDGVTILPFLSLIEFSSVIKASSWAIIRGEVSFITTLQLGTPFLWDMYKEIGGFPHEQASDFLSWYGADDTYMDVFYRLNGIREGGVSISEVNSYFGGMPKRPTSKSGNLVEELQKYIDKYHFSL